jgi:hypothetical protein
LFQVKDNLSIAVKEYALWKQEEAIKKTFSFAVVEIDLTLYLNACKFRQNLYLTDRERGKPGSYYMY